MSDITANVVVSMPSQLFTMARSFKAVANGKIYIGKIDTDPVNPENQIQVYVQNEDDLTFLYRNQSSLTLLVTLYITDRLPNSLPCKGHSMAVYDAYGAQQFYFPNVLKYNPDRSDRIFFSSYPKQEYMLKMTRKVMQCWR